MNKFILSSFLLLLFLVVVSSRDFNVVSGNNNFKTSDELRGVYSQQDKNSDGGYHKAEIAFKTKVPSFNPDQSGVKSVDCKKGKNGSKEISLSLKDKDAIETVKDWPEKVMLLISHKWKCFGKKTTQFFMVTNRNINESDKLVTFVTERCDVPDWSNDYSIDLSWVNGVSKNNNTRRRLDERFGIPFPTINPSVKIPLNALFDARRRRSSRRNIPIVNTSGIKLFCTNCFMNGDATMSLRIAGNIFPPKLKDASVTLNGNFLMNLDFALEASLGKSITVNDFKLVSIPLSPFNIPGVFNAGPSLDVVASTEIGANISGKLEFGGDLSLPNFNAKASFKGTPSFEQSGFTPKVNAHKPKGKIEASVNISCSLKPQLALGVSILNGRILDQRIGFEIVGTLENSLTIGTRNKCRRKTQPRLTSTLNGNIGFFVNDNGFPIVEFPSLTLLNKCLF